MLSIYIALNPACPNGLTSLRLSPPATSEGGRLTRLAGRSWEAPGAGDKRLPRWEIRSWQVASWELTNGCQVQWSAESWQGVGKGLAGSWQIVGECSCN